MVKNLTREELKKEVNRSFSMPKTQRRESESRVESELRRIPSTVKKDKT